MLICTNYLVYLVFLVLVSSYQSKIFDTALEMAEEAEMVNQGLYWVCVGVPHAILDLYKLRQVLYVHRLAQSNRSGRCSHFHITKGSTGL